MPASTEEAAFAHLCPSIEEHCDCVLLQPLSTHPMSPVLIPVSVNIYKRNRCKQEIYKYI